MRKHLAAHWFLFHETPLRLVRTDVVLKSGRHISDSDATAVEMSQVRWQPDL